MSKLKIKKNDQVEVISGDYKGTKAKVLKVLPARNKIIVEGVNMVRRHVKPDAENTQGGIIQKEAPIHISNVLVVDPSSKRGERIGRRANADGKIVRFFKGSDNELK
jgi:large subunit ribosomal protein L24